jgi:PTS system mannose-specific IIA component
MFGGTPSNLSLSLLTRGKIEIVTGVNLPMIIEAASNSPKVSLNELVRMLTSSGQREIRSAGEVLDKKVAERKER